MTTKKVAERQGQTQIAVRLSDEVAEDFKRFCWENRISQIEAFERGFDLLRQEVARTKPSMDPKCRMLADAFKVALKEAKDERIL